MPDQVGDTPTISGQLTALAGQESLVKRVDGLAYGQIVFEIREGRIYRVNVTSSLLLKSQDLLPPKTERRTLYSTEKSKT